MGQREHNGFMKQTDVANILYAEIVQRQRHEPQKLVSVGSNPTLSTIYIKNRILIFYKKYDIIYIVSEGSGRACKTK